MGWTYHGLMISMETEISFDQDNDTTDIVP